MCCTGRVVGNLVREFLEYFKLDYSVAVFEPESNSVSNIIVILSKYSFSVLLFT